MKIYYYQIIRQAIIENKYTLQIESEIIVLKKNEEVALYYIR